MTVLQLLLERKQLKKYFEEIFKKFTSIIYLSFSIDKFCSVVYHPSY